MKYRINLIYRKKESFTEKALYFIYHYLRYTIVITQIVVIFVFFNKIRYDQEIIDLQETISQQKEIFKVTKPLIEEYLIIKKKIDKIQNLFSSQKKLNNQWKYLLSVFPENINLIELRFEKNNFVLIGKTVDSGLIKAFYNRLKKDNLFHHVILEDIRKNDFDYSFTIKLGDFK